MLEAVKWENGKVVLIDQTRLPIELVFKRCDTYQQVAESIKRLEVRGAPAIGIAGAMGFALGVLNTKANDFDSLKEQAKKISQVLASTRPTAINLFWALDRMKKVIDENKLLSLDEIKQKLIEESIKIHQEDKDMCNAIAENGAKLIKDGDTILTHCNTGLLATGGIGTALGAIYKAYEQGKKIKVYADETRPLLQGSRLTVWELMQGGIDVTLISDNMAGWLMKSKKIDCVMLGADRIAKNGDTANKIGTYSLAVLANKHSIPFYVVAPTSTIDNSIQSGDMIPIEERDSNEVRKIKNTLITVSDVKVFNPAFDITDSNLITGIITEKGIFNYPYNFFNHKFI